MSQFIYTLRPCRLEMLTSGPTPEESVALAAHVQYLEDLAGEGAVLLAGRTQTADEQTFGIVILEVGLESDAQTIMKSDPAILNGLMTGQLFPYQIAVASPNIATKAVQ
jgi:uncharacterized protein